MLEPFAGARWWKFDFHTHTPASLDTPWSGIENEKERLSPEQWLLRFMKARIDCVAVTDHNTADWIDSLKNAYSRLASERPAGFRPLCLFPGVELSVNGGFHLLAVFDPGATRRDVSDLIARVEYQGTPGRCDGVTRKSATEVVELVADLGALAIPAHVDQENGLLQTAGDTGQLALDANTVGPGDPPAGDTGRGGRESRLGRAPDLQRCRLCMDCRCRERLSQFPAGRQAGRSLYVGEDGAAVDGGTAPRASGRRAVVGSSQRPGGWRPQRVAAACDRGVACRQRPPRRAR